MPVLSHRSIAIATTILTLFSAISARAQSTTEPATGYAYPRNTSLNAAQADETILVQAKKRNQTQVMQSGQLGALGNQKALDVPFSIKSYTSSLILNQQPQTLGQVLENDPSVRTTDGFGNFSEIFVIRGFPLDSDDVSIDGLYGVAPRQLVSPELFDQVQVLDGANAFLNGAAPGGSAIGGGVNLTMKRATDAPLTRLTGNYASDSLGGGALDVGRRFGTDNQFGARINVAGSSGGTELDGEHRDSVVVGGAFDWRSARAHVSLDIDYQNKGVNFGRSEVFLDSTATAIPKVPSNTRNYGERWSFTRLKDVFGILHGDYTLLPHLSVYGDLGGRDGSENGSYTSLTVTDVTNGAATAGFLGVPRTDDNESVRGGIRADLTTGPIHHEINLGGSSLWETGRYGYTFGSSVSDNLYRPTYAAQPPITLTGGDVEDPFPINRTRLQSVYGSDTLSFFDGRALLIVGVRDQNIFERGYSYSGGSETSRYNASKATPVVGVVIHPTAETALYFNRIEGLSPGDVAPATANNPGQIFAPYSSVQYEVGAKLQLTHFSSSFALFQIEQPSSYSQANGDGTTSFVENGNQRNRGIEWNVSGEIARGLRVIGGATYNDPRLVNTAGGATNGNKAIGVPDYTINANVEYDLPFLLGGTVTGRVIRTGTQEVNTTNTLQLPAWTRFDLGARYTFLTQKKPVTIRVGVDNVANERYWESSYGGYLLQSDARTYKFSLSVDF